MADNINNSLDKTQNTLEVIEKTSERILKLENEINNNTSRIKPYLIGEDTINEQEGELRTLTKLNNELEEYKTEIKSIQNINVNANNADALLVRVNELNEKISKTKETIKEVYDIAAHSTVNEFDTSNGIGQKSLLNSYVSKMKDYADYDTSHNDKLIDDAMKEVDKADGEIIESISKKLRDKITNLSNKMNSEGLNEKEQKEYTKAVNEFNEAYFKKSREIFEKNIEKNFGDLIRLANKQFDENNNFIGIDVRTIGLAINELFKDKGKKIADAVYTNDILENQMGAFTRTGIREGTLASNPENLLFGKDYTSNNIEGLKQEIEDLTNDLKSNFPQGANTPPDGRIYYNKEEVEFAYNEQVTLIKSLNTELNNAIKAVEQSGGYLTMFEKLDSAIKSLTIPNQIADNMHVQMFNEGKTLDQIIKESYEIKLNPTENEVTAKKIDEEIVNRIKGSIERLATSDLLKNAGKANEVVSSENIERTRERIKKTNEEYNNLRQTIINTPIDTVSTGANFDVQQIKNYENSLDSLISEGNQLREVMVDNFNRINDISIKGITNIDTRWNDFVKNATSEVRLHLSDEESINKVRLIDSIMNDIKLKANDFSIIDNEDAKVFSEIELQLKHIKDKKEQFGKNDDRFVINDIQIQRLSMAIEILKRYRKQTSDIRNENYDTEQTKYLDSLIENITKRINSLQEVNKNIKEAANALGVKIEDVPQVKYSNRIVNSTFGLIDRNKQEKIDWENKLYKDRLKSGPYQLTEYAEANKEIQKKIDEENKRHEQEVRNINKEAEDLKRIASIANKDYTESESKSESKQEKIKKQWKEEAQQIDIIKNKLNEYNQQLSNMDTDSFDKTISKLKIYEKELDKAIQKNDVARAQGIFDLYGKEFSHLEGQQKASDIGKKRQLEEEKQAAKEEADRERVLQEEQKIRVKIAEDAEKRYQEAIEATKQKLETVKGKVTEVANVVKQSVANIIKAIRTVNSILEKSILAIVSIFSGLGSAIERVLRLFGNFGDRLGLVNNHGNILKGTFTELKSKIDLVVGAFNKLFNNSFINEGKKLLSSVQTLKMLIGPELTAQTMEWATNLEYAFGLSAAGLIADLKELTAVMYGLGMTSQDVQVAATNLEAVAMSLSATTGYDFSTVVNKIQSGMKGMTQSIDDLGLSVRESQMDAFLKKLKAQGGEYANIGTSFSSLTEQQRIYVRYAAIMDQFTSKGAYSAENYAKSLRTITGSLSILTSQLRGLKSDIGSLALQLFAKIVQPIIYIIYLIRQAIKWLANLLGIDITINPFMNDTEEQAANPTEAVDDMTDSLEKEADAADKAKNALDGWDHITTMSTNKNSGKDEFDYSKLMGNTADFAGALEEMAKARDNFIEECKQKFLEMLNNLKNKFTQWIKDVTGRIIDWDKIKENLKYVWENIKKIFDNLKRIAKAAFDIIGGLLFNIFDDLDGTTLLAKFSDVLERLTRLIATILEKVKKPIIDFYDKYLSKYVVKFGDWLESKLDAATAKLDEWIAWWEDPKNEDTINAWFDNLGEKFENLVKFIKELVVVFKTLFGGELTEADNEVISGMSDGMLLAVDIANNLHDIFTGILDVIKQIGLNIGLLQVSKNDKGEDKLGINLEFFQKIFEVVNEKLKEISTWINDNKDKIADIAAEVISVIAALAEAKFDIIMTILKWITDNSDTVLTILRTLKDVIKYVAEHPLESALQGVVGLTAFNVGKTALTAVMWKKILGLGVGGTAAKAAAEGGKMIAKEVANGAAGAEGGKIIAKGAAAGGTGILAGLTSTLGVILGNSTQMAVGIKGAQEGFQVIKDGLDDIFGVASGFNKETDESFKITSDNVKTYAYEVRRALIEAYGQDIDTSKVEQAINVYSNSLQDSLNLTDEQTKRVNESITRQYNRMSNSIDKTKNALDGAAATATYSTNTSEKNISAMAETLKNLDASTTESTTSVNNSFDETAKKSDILNRNLQESTNGINNSFINMSSNINRDVLKTGGDFNYLSWKCKQTSNDITNTFNSLDVSVSNSCNNIAANIQRIQGYNLAIDQYTTQRTVLSNPGKLKGFTYANGGIPTSGSLFMANENGNTELVGNFGGYTGVANQDMILDAMQNAIGKSVYSAMQSAMKNNQSGGNTVIEVCKGGMFVGDQSTVRKLANMINNANTSGRTNIANTSFSMS